MTRKGIAFFDWDFTLVHFPHKAGVEAVREWSAERWNPATADYIAEVFNICFERGMRWSRRMDAPEATDELAQTLKQLEQGVVCTGERPDSFMWSRELWSATALSLLRKKYMLAMDSYSPFAITEAYWEGIAQQGKPYEEAAKVLADIRNNGWQIVIVTSSDFRLVPTPDAFVGFRYDPGFSTETKIFRMWQSGILTREDVVVVGDPISKPDPRFWERALSVSDWKHPEKAMMVGDSYATDIAGAPPEFTTLLIDREGKYTGTDTPRASAVISNLTEVLNWVK